MAEQSWWRRAIAAVNREYDRRIRRASLVTEYGAGSHDHDEPGHPAAHIAAQTPPDPEEEAAEILNVPKGTPIRRSAPSDIAPETEQPSA